MNKRQRKKNLKKWIKANPGIIDDFVRGLSDCLWRSVAVVGDMFILGIDSPGGEVGDTKQIENSFKESL